MLISIIKNNPFFQFIHLLQAMTKSKKHSPIQSEETGSVVGQIPSDKMEAFAAGLEELMSKSISVSGSPQELMENDPNLILDYNVKP